MTKLKAAFRMLLLATGLSLLLPHSSFGALPGEISLLVRNADWVKIERELQENSHPQELMPKYLVLDQFQDPRRCKWLGPFLYYDHSVRGSYYFARRTQAKFLTLTKVLGHLEERTLKPIPAEDPLFRVLKEARKTMASNKLGIGAYAAALRALIPHLDQDSADAAELWLYLYEGLQWLEDPTVPELGGAGRLEQFGFWDDYIETYIRSSQLLHSLFSHPSSKNLKSLLAHLRDAEDDVRDMSSGIGGFIDDVHTRIGDVSAEAEACELEQHPEKHLAQLGSKVDGYRSAIVAQQSAMELVENTLLAALMDIESWRAFADYAAKNIMLQDNLELAGLSKALIELGTRGHGAESLLASQLGKALELQAYTESAVKEAPITMNRVVREALLETLKERDENKLKDLLLYAKTLNKGLAKRSQLWSQEAKFNSPPPPTNLGR